MQRTMLPTILIPGAWMGAWIWEPVVTQLKNRGVPAETITLTGLEKDIDPETIARITLNDHLRQLTDVIAQSQSQVILVGHSYSSMVTAQVADQVAERVAGLIHFGGFLPVNGRSLLDDWGESDEERESERADIKGAGNLWMPPTAEMLGYENDLQPDERAFLAENFTPHPGSTVTDRAVMNAPIERQPTTYIAQSTSTGEAAWADAPEVARNAHEWRRRHIHSGHWPMISNPEATTDLIAEEVAFYSNWANSRAATF